MSLTVDTVLEYTLDKKDGLVDGGAGGASFFGGAEGASGAAAGGAVAGWELLSAAGAAERVDGRVFSKPSGTSAGAEVTLAATAWGLLPAAAAAPDRAKSSGTGDKVGVGLGGRELGGFCGASVFLLGAGGVAAAASLALGPKPKFGLRLVSTLEAPNNA